MNVDATSSRRIDVKTTSFWHQMPTGVDLSDDNFAHVQGFQIMPLSDNPYYYYCNGLDEWLVVFGLWLFEAVVYFKEKEDRICCSILFHKRAAHITSQQSLSTLSCFQLPYLSWQSPFLSTLKCYLPSSSSVYLLFFFLSSFHCALYDSLC